MGELARAQGTGGYHATLDEGACDGCRLCLPACKCGALLTIPGESAPMVDPYACSGCGNCVTACPTGALQIQPRVMA